MAKWEERFSLCGAAKEVVNNSNYLANGLIKDLILKCKLTTGRQWRNTFPQAKHKSNNEKCQNIKRGSSAVRKWMKMPAV